MVAQICPRWNPLTSWMRQMEDSQESRKAVCQTESACRQPSMFLASLRRLNDLVGVGSRGPVLAPRRDNVGTTPRSKRAEHSLTRYSRSDLRMTGALTCPNTGRIPIALPRIARKPAQTRWNQISGILITEDHIKIGARDATHDLQAPLSPCSVSATRRPLVQYPRLGGRNRRVRPAGTPRTLR
jgi:hypothetical protein